MSSVRELLIVGASGMLGTALTRVAASQGYVPRAYSEAELDITDRAAMRATVTGFATLVSRAGVHGAVVNAAAYTEVEKAEDDAERAYLVNERAAGWLAAGAWDEGLALVHVSTDFVFDGAKTEAYLESEVPHPLNVYGASKLAGERAVFSSHPAALVIRTSWTYGLGGTNFPMKILERARTATRGAAAGAASARLGAATGSTREAPSDDLVAPVLRVVADEIGSPTYTIDLANGLLALLSAGATGLYHLTGAGSCSRYELALETLRLAGFRVPGDLTVERVMSAGFPTKAMRPLGSVLDCGKAAGLDVRLPAWQDGLARFLAELRSGGEVALCAPTSS
jgi:dTDP-4-dehydrorhamnose reductase